MSTTPDHGIAVLVSGTGRHLENLCQLAADGSLGGVVTLCISSRPGVLALERAEKAAVPALVVEKGSAEDDRAYGLRIFEEIRAAGADTVVLAGFLKKLWIPEDYRGRVINIHPSLLPAFGGKGFYGHRVHSAVLSRGCQVSGCTVHLVDEVYDNGPILVQRWCPVEPDDTADTLATRVFELELQALPEGLRRFWALPS
ncbi:MAG: phosphoribosylglycinamide formyltransferase [Planctomycetota bacterium]|nr:phosphoribosylglycinamide formyltransferase [Planctomycetota bacterium]